jgi:hypothetical protein
MLARRFLGNFLPPAWYTLQEKGVFSRSDEKAIAHAAFFTGQVTEFVDQMLHFH